MPQQSPPPGELTLAYKKEAPFSPLPPARTRRAAKPLPLFLLPFPAPQHFSPSQTDAARSPHHVFERYVASCLTLTPPAGHSRYTHTAWARMAGVLTKCCPAWCPAHVRSTAAPPSLKAIREFDAKLLVSYWLPRAPIFSDHLAVSSQPPVSSCQVAHVAWDPATNTITDEADLPPWVFNTKLVAKPDQLIKRRGKAGLLKLNVDWVSAQQWIRERAGKSQQVRNGSPLAYAISSGTAVIC